MAKSASHVLHNKSKSKRQDGRSNRAPPLQNKSVNPLKLKIRDLERLLNHSDRLPADVRIEKERALAGYKQDLNTTVEEKQKQKMISRYHKVRFFERQKATRNLKQLKNTLAAASPNNEDYKMLEDAVHRAGVDLDYTVFYPLTEKYSSLFPRETAIGSARSSANLPEPIIAYGESSLRSSTMWKVVEACAGEGNLTLLREGKLSSRYSRSTDKEQRKINQNQEPMNATRVPKADKSRKRATRSRSDDEESDGGFFEK